MPATIGIKAASATNWAIESSNRLITRDAITAVTRLIASQAQRFRTERRIGAKMSSYWSAHLPSTESELIVPTGHGGFAHPLAVQELIRILKLELEGRASAGAAIGADVGL